MKCSEYIFALMQLKKSTKHYLPMGNHCQFFSIHVEDVMKPNYSKISKRCVIGFFCIVLLPSCANLRNSVDEDDVPLATFLVGVQHIGKQYTVPEFYVDGYSGGALGVVRTAASWICCVVLPMKPKNTVIAKIRWKVIDWSKSSPEDVLTNYKNAVYLGPYHADVPVENTDESGSLYIHFFSDGKVRAVVSKYAIENPLHPVNYDDNDGGKSATVGVRIKKIFPF